jgi:uncharacterized protein Yka (UPF0111/DUF47 family)
MFGSFVPREGKFFELFVESGNLGVEATAKFKELVSDFPNLETHSRSIKEIEHKADDVTHRCIELLHTTFITPIDREDIHKLISEMDSIIDFMEAASQRIYLYGITESTPALSGLADVCHRSMVHVSQAVAQIHNLEFSDEIRKNCVEINRLENEADSILRSAVAALFREEDDIRKLIKLKEIYELLEEVTDRCEDVANILEGITLEYS